MSPPTEPRSEARTERAFAQACAAYDRGEFAEAVRIFSPLTAEGHPGSALRLGDCLYKGLGCAQDHAEALRCFRTAAASGLSTAGEITAVLEQHLEIEAQRDALKPYWT
jgi:TPR repeat protein